MNNTHNEVIVHLDESIDDAAFDDLEQAIRRDHGIVAVQRRGRQRHLLLVVYDSAVARASNILHNFHERGLHAQLVGM